MDTRSLCLTGLLGAVIAGGAIAQQPARPGQAPGPAPARAGQTPAARDSTPATVTVAARGEEARIYLGVKGTNSSARATLLDMANKADIRLLLAPSVRGTFTGDIESKPAEEAIMDVAKLAGLTVRKIAVPASGASSVTAEVAGGIASAMTSLPVGAVVTDPATGKSVTVAATAPAAATGTTTLLYVQGTAAPGMDRTARGAGAMGPAAPAAPLGAASQDFVNKTAQSLQQMPMAHRMETMRALQRQMFENMTPEEREQMRGQFRGRDGGQPGGFGGGRRGNRGGDNQDNPQ